LSGAGLTVGGDYFALEKIEITGIVTGLTQSNYTFIATVSPFTSTRPITYVWQTTDAQTEATTTTQALSASVRFSWPTTGTKTITVSASNAGGTVSSTRIITISAPPVVTYTIFLPTVLKNYTAVTTDTAEITNISVQGSQYAVQFETFNFTPIMPGQHVHFFFDTTPPEMAGLPNGNPADWYAYSGSSPFTGFSVSDRPNGAAKMCILVANEDHSVQINTGNCYPLPN